MRFTKSTSDHLFTISIESDFLDADTADDTPIPKESLKQLILELEIMAVELRKFLLEDDEALPN